MSNKRAEKSVFIASYLRTLSPREVLQATRCLSGYLFPVRDQKTLNVSSLILINCVASCMGVPGSFVKDQLSRVGNLGELVKELFASGVSIPVSDRLTLDDVISTAVHLSSVSGARKKSEIIANLLRRSSPLEAKFLVRILSGNLEIGLQESDVEDAVSRWQNINISRVQSANMLLGDIGETALLCLNGNINEARMNIYAPINYMHATAVTLDDDLLGLLPEQFVIEEKFDGIRAQVHIGLDVPGLAPEIGATHDGLRIAIFSDQLEDITQKFLDLIPGLAALLCEPAGTVEAVGVILDGLIVPMREREIAPFSELQERIKATNAGLEPADLTPVGYVIFDQLFGDGRSLIQENWFTRAASLDKVPFDLVTTFRVRSTVCASVREIELALEKSEIKGSQGIMVKNPKSSYRPGRRGTEWLKICCREAPAIK